LDEYHVLDRKTRYYFQPFRSNKEWVGSRYPSTGLQTVNTQTFAGAFIHKSGSNLWAFSLDYISFIKDKLREIHIIEPVPSDVLAVWLFKDKDIGVINNYDDLVSLFFEEFNIGSEERGTLFQTKSLNISIPEEDAFVSEPLIISEVAARFSLPPDSEEQNARTLESIALCNVGPASNIEMEFGQRLTLVTWR
jgi:hypothetical protein